MLSQTLGAPAPLARVMRRSFALSGAQSQGSGLRQDDNRRSTSKRALR